MRKHKTLYNETGYCNIHYIILESLQIHSNPVLVTIIKYLRKLIYMRKGLFCLIVLEIPVYDKVTISLRLLWQGTTSWQKHMVEQFNFHHKPGKQKTKTSRMGSQNLLQGHVPIMTSHKNHLLKVPLLPNTAILTIKPVNNGPLQCSHPHY
jgi:hypothetical protein